MRKRVWIAAALALAATVAGFGWRDARRAGVVVAAQTSATATVPTENGETAEAPLAGSPAAAAAPGALSLPIGCDPLRVQEQLAANDREHALAMMRQPDSRSRLFAAYLLDGAHDDVAVAARESALADTLRMPSEDPLVLWAQLADCNEGDACRHDEALAGLQALEPDNAVVWLAGMSEGADQDAERLAVNEALLRRAARSRYYRTAFGDLD